MEEEKPKYYVEVLSNFMNITSSSEMANFNDFIHRAVSDRYIDDVHKLRFEELFLSIKARVRNFLGNRKTKRLSLESFQRIASLKVSLENLQPAADIDSLRHIPLPKLSFFALDSVLVDFYNSGKAFFLFDKDQDGTWFYWNLLCLVSPPRQPLAEKDLKIPVANWDYFPIIENHTNQCASCRALLDQQRSVWEKEIQDSLKAP